MLLKEFDTLKESQKKEVVNKLKIRLQYSMTTWSSFLGLIRDLEKKDTKEISDATMLRLFEEIDTLDREHSSEWLKGIWHKEHSNFEYAFEKKLFSRKETTDPSTTASDEADIQLRQMYSELIEITGGLNKPLSKHKSNA